MVNFQKLEVYKKAQEVISDIYTITKEFPKGERFGLIDQMRRASVSIAANIAEGSGRYHPKDYIQFLRIARSSSYEVIALLDVSLAQGYLDGNAYEIVYNRTEQMNKMLNVFITSISKRGSYECNK